MIYIWYVYIYMICLYIYDIWIIYDMYIYIWYMIYDYDIDMTVTSCEDLSGVYPKCSHCFPVSPSASSTAGELDPVADRTVLPFIGVIFALVFLIIYMVKASGGQPHPKPMHGYHLCWALKEGACILASAEVVPNFSGTRFLEDSSCKPIHSNSRSCCFQPYKKPPTILIPVHVCFWYGILHASWILCSMFIPPIIAMVSLPPTILMPSWWVGTWDSETSVAWRWHDQLCWEDGDWKVI